MCRGVAHGSAGIRAVVAALALGLVGIDHANAGLVADGFGRIYGGALIVGSASGFGDTNAGRVADGFGRIFGNAFIVRGAFGFFFACAVFAYFFTTAFGGCEITAFAFQKHAIAVAFVDSALLAGIWIVDTRIDAANLSFTTAAGRLVFAVTSALLDHGVGCTCIRRAFGDKAVVTNIALAAGAFLDCVGSIVTIHKHRIVDALACICAIAIFSV